MKKLFLYTLLILTFSACKKTNEVHLPEPEPGPAMQYSNLQDAEIKFGQLKTIDIDNDGTADFFFSTLLVGDPILERDRRQYYAHSKVECYLLNNDDDQSPVMNKGDKIAKEIPGYNWYEVSAIVIAEKIIPVYGPPFWNGLWTQAGHKYLPVNIKKNGVFYFGWIEISFDTITEKIILHKAAICKEPGKEIYAGI